MRKDSGEATSQTGTATWASCPLVDAAWAGDGRCAGKAGGRLVYDL